MLFRSLSVCKAHLHPHHRTCVQTLTHTSPPHEHSNTSTVLILLSELYTRWSASCSIFSLTPVFSYPLPKELHRWPVVCMARCTLLLCCKLCEFSVKVKHLTTGLQCLHAVFGSASETERVSGVPISNE